LTARTVDQINAVPKGFVLPFSSVVTWPDEVPVTLRLTDAAGETAEATTDVRPPTAMGSTGSSC